MFGGKGEFPFIEGRLASCLHKGKSVNFEYYGIVKSGSTCKLPMFDGHEGFYFPDEGVLDNFMKFDIDFLNNIFLILVGEIFLRDLDPHVF